MSNPFRDPSIWIRGVAFSAAIFGISLGLCGLNIEASQLVAKNHPLELLGPVLSITALVEIGGMAIGAAGIALSLLGLLLQIFWRLAFRRRP
jgi:hypothetical protein